MAGLVQIFCRLSLLDITPLRGPRTTNPFKAALGFDGPEQHERDNLGLGEL